MVTALDEPEDKVKGLKMGADEFLNKPVNTSELQARVQSLCRLKTFGEQLTARSQSEESLIVPQSQEEPREATIDVPSILLVEDNDTDAKLIKAYLAEETYKITQVKDGEEAIARVQCDRVDIILLDILLPNMDGFEVCRRLKKKDLTKNIQIVIISSLNDLKSKVKGIELGADDFLLKPVNREVLKARIKTLLKKKAYMDSLSTRFETALHAAITDKLTGLYNSAYFKQFLEHELKRSQRQNHALALLMIDLDDFKQYNDTQGHLAGDEVLKEFGQVVKGGIREVDLAARYGGEQFAVILPYTNRKGALTVSERIRKLVSSHFSTHEAGSSPAPMTVSIGIGLFSSDISKIEDLIEKADLALYRAKREGKNRVCE